MTRKFVKRSIFFHEYHCIHHNLSLEWSYMALILCLLWSSRELGDDTRWQRMVFSPDDPHLYVPNCIVSNIIHLPLMFSAFTPITGCFRLWTILLDYWIILTLTNVTFAMCHVYGMPKRSPKEQTIAHDWSTWCLVPLMTTYTLAWLFNFIAFLLDICQLLNCML